MAEGLEKVVLDGREPYALVLGMLKHLRAFGPTGVAKAAWIEDVYSEVLKGLEQDNLADTSWIDALTDVCSKQLNALALNDKRVSGLHFGEAEPGLWKWTEVEPWMMSRS